VANTREPTNSERNLASIAVQMTIMAAERLHGKPIEEVAAWANRQLTLMGYENESMGSEWAYLTAVSTDKDSR
jgi:hypothetical protein